MAEGFGFAWPRSVGLVEGEDLQISTQENNDFLQAYINTSMLFLSDDEWLFGGMDLKEVSNIYDNADTPKKRIKLAADGDIDFFDADGSTERININNDGNIIFRDADGNIRLQLVNNGDINFFDPDGISERFNIVNNGNISWKDKGGAVVLQWDEAASAIQADDGATGQKSIFPKAYLDTGLVRVVADETNISSSGEGIGEQSIACDYNNQNVMVQLDVSATWINTTPGNRYTIRCYVQNVEVGAQNLMEMAATDAGGDGVDIDGSVASDGDGVDVAGISGDLPGHIHLSGTYAVNGNHAHASGSLAVNGNHSHLANWLRLTQTAHVNLETAAGSSGNLKLAIFATGDDVADITEYTITWTIWRR